ncbi:hypothetical protein K438DRAFT_1786323 [Mycena galopus ATCC 62051]|nr:hypothetical protein K438DRAFT_1786323 [Mycena galopus ATCC 62051]
MSQMPKDISIIIAGCPGGLFLPVATVGTRGVIPTLITADFWALWVLFRACLYPPDANFLGLEYIFACCVCQCRLNTSLVLELVAAKIPGTSEHIWSLSLLPSVATALPPTVHFKLWVSSKSVDATGQPSLFQKLIVTLQYWQPVQLAVNA